MSIARLLQKSALTTLTLVLAGPLASLAQPLQPAKGVDGQPAITVTYSDLDLTRSADLDVLFKRLKSAAKTTCAQFDGSRELARRALFDACIDQALAGAVLQTKLPALSVLYTAKTGHKLAPSLIMTAHR